MFFKTSCWIITEIRSSLGKSNPSFIQKPRITRLSSYLATCCLKVLCFGRYPINKQLVKKDFLILPSIFPFLPSMELPSQIIRCSISQPRSAGGYMNVLSRCKNELRLGEAVSPTGKRRSFFPKLRNNVKNDEKCISAWIFFLGVLKWMMFGVQTTPSLRVQTAPELEDASLDFVVWMDLVGLCGPQTCGKTHNTAAHFFRISGNQCFQNNKCFGTPSHSALQFQFELANQ